MASALKNVALTTVSAAPTLSAAPAPAPTAPTSLAFSRSPSHSPSAFLQSIMPAPVLSRSSFTRAAEMPPAAAAAALGAASALGAAAAAAGAGAAAGAASSFLASAFLVSAAAGAASALAGAAAALAGCSRRWQRRAAGCVGRCGVRRLPYRTAGC